MTDTTPQINTDPTIPVSKRENLPGAVLRARREAKGLSREEVAERLHLDLKIITALEEDNHHKLPGHAYVLGYLRSYARLLAIPEQEILGLLQTDTQAVADLLPPNVNYKPEPASLPGIAVIVGIILLVLIAVGVAFWPEGENETTSDTKTTSALVEQTVDAAPVTESQSMELSEQQAAADNAPHIQKAPHAESVKVEEVTEAQAKADLVLHFKEASWTEIYDADGKRLLYGMINKGERLEIEGKQPFSILFGNAAGVKVVFRDKEFDHARFIRNDVAQFVIGSSRFNQ